MSSNDLDLRSILYQSQLRSKPIRLNYQDIETEFNALRAEVNAGIASTASEVTSARHNMDTLSNNIKLRRVWTNRVVEDTHFKVTELGTPTLSVQIGIGSGIVEGEGVTLTAAITSATINTAASGKHRLDAVVISKNNTAYIKEGAEVQTASAVVYPTIASSEMILGHFEVTNTTSAIENADITDDRVRAINPFADWQDLKKAYTYQGDTLSTVTVTDVDGVEYAIGITYTGALIASTGVTVGTVRYTKNYTYDANDFITESNIVLS